MGENSDVSPGVPASTTGPQSSDWDSFVLGSAIADILRAVGEPQGLGLITHVLRGSSGPATQALISLHRPPHVGRLSELDFKTAAGKVEDAARAHPGLVLDMVPPTGATSGPRKRIGLSASTNI